MKKKEIGLIFFILGMIMIHMQLLVTFAISYSALLFKRYTAGVAINFLTAPISLLTFGVAIVLCIIGYSLFKK